jgi:hypothetical protein
MEPQRVTALRELVPRSPNSGSGLKSSLTSRFAPSGRATLLRVDPLLCYAAGRALHLRTCYSGSACHSQRRARRIAVCAAARWASGARRTRTPAPSGEYSMRSLIRHSSAGRQSSFAQRKAQLALAPIPRAHCLTCLEGTPRRRTELSVTPRRANLNRDRHSAPQRATQLALRRSYVAGAHVRQPDNRRQRPSDVAPAACGLAIPRGSARLFQFGPISRRAAKLACGLRRAELRYFPASRNACPRNSRIA